ncbi:MAG: tetratricopeptide repeat protein [Armatimonadetes bacterium]|nr:tetratricopeptide repeat protein [Armatimonadota bacterium]
MKTWLLSVGIFGAALGVGWRLPELRPVVNPPQSSSTLDAHETSATASLVGQFRTSLSSWLWLRTDLYLHNGVQMRRMTREEIASGRQAETPHHEGEHDEIAKGETDVVTVIPPKERDFRGVFGDVERAISAYKDMKGHTHNDPRKALPLFRLMAWLDPEFTAAWTTGAYVYSLDRTPEAYARAIAFLREGLRANPDSIELHQQMGQALLVWRREPEQARRHLERAIELGKRLQTGMSEETSEALLSAYRWLALLLRDQGQREEMRRVAWEGLRAFPDDRVLARQAVDPPSIYTDEAVDRMIRWAMDAARRN